MLLHRNNNTMPRSTNTKEFAKYTNRTEWLIQNEDRIREFWNAMRNFLEHNNSFLLNACSFESLCEFIADNSLHFDDK